MAGRPVRVSTGTEKRKEAEAFLKRREGAVVNGAPIPPRADRIRYEEIADDLRVYYETTGKRDPKEAEVRLAHLDRFFTQIRVVAITPDQITRYAQARQQEGAANATINRELATISQMLRLAYKNGKVLRLPPIEKLTEADPRSGFFERDQYDSVFRHLADDLQVAAAIAHTYGWRTQSEVLTRERRHWTLVRARFASTPARRRTRRAASST